MKNHFASSNYRSRKSFSKWTGHIQKKRSTSTHPRTARLRSALTISSVLLFLLLQVTSLSYAVPQKPKKGKFGSIKILTSPGGLPLLIDDRPQGKTTVDYRSFDLAPGLHTVAISLPDGQRWNREINVVSKQILCIAINYTPGVPEGSNPQPTPSTTDRKMSDGEVLVIFSNGARLDGTIVSCGEIAIPKVPWWKKVIRKKS